MQGKWPLAVYNILRDWSLIKIKKMLKRFNAS